MTSHILHISQIWSCDLLTRKIGELYYARIPSILFESGKKKAFLGVLFIDEKPREFMLKNSVQANFKLRFLKIWNGSFL